VTGLSPSSIFFIGPCFVLAAHWGGDHVEQHHRVQPSSVRCYVKCRHRSHVSLRGLVSAVRATKASLCDWVSQLATSQRLRSSLIGEPSVLSLLWRSRCSLVRTLGSAPGNDQRELSAAAGRYIQGLVLVDHRPLSRTSIRGAGIAGAYESPAGRSYAAWAVSRLSCPFGAPHGTLLSCAWPTYGSNHSVRLQMSSSPGKPGPSSGPAE
jgi:hypothetical protein